MIAGAIPNAIKPNPVTDANNTKNVIQSGGRNRLELEDQSGQEKITLSTPYQNSSLKMGAAGDHEFINTTDGRGLWKTGKDSDFDIGGRWVVKVDQSLQEKISGSVTETYGSSQTTTVSGAFTETLSSGSTQTISAVSTKTITGAETRTVSGGLTESITGGETRDVSGSFTESVNGAWTQSVNGAVTQTTTGATTHTITGSLTQTVVGGATVTTPAAFNLTAAGGVNIDCAAGLNVVAPGGVQFIAPGGFTVIAPGGIRTVDESLTSHGGFHCNYFGMIMAFTGLKMDLTGAAIAGTLVKAEAVGFGAKFWAAEFANKEAKIQMGAFKLSGFGFNLVDSVISLFM